MKVDQPNLREVRFDCPWVGHAYAPDGLRVVNSRRPELVGMQCVKCGCLIYERRRVGPIVGPGGEALVQAAPAPEQEG
jgi:hypothetical protein